MDSYQAIYDAVRSKISGGDVGSAVREAAERAFDFSHMRAILQQEFCIAAAEMVRPSAIYRPALMADGDQWLALYGEDIMSGLAGFGDTPEAAMRAFDKAWHEQKPPGTNRTDPPTT